MNHTSPAPADYFHLERSVIAALDRADDDGLWRALRQASDEDRLLRTIAEEAPRLAYRQRAASVFSELLLVPVVETQHGSVIGNAEAWKNAERCISEAFRMWLGRLRAHTMFRGVLPYEWIACWKPSMLRHHLLAAAPAGKPGNLTFRPPSLRLAHGAPRLGFIAVSVRDTRGWPQLPAPDTVRDTRFRQVIDHAFAMGSGVQTLPPDQVPAALADGLCLWLASIHDAVTIAGWDLSPCESAHDAVNVALTVNTDHEASIRFTIRRHQVAPVGVDAIACMLTSLAPRIGAERVN